MRSDAGRTGLGRNMVVNIAGQVAPLVAALFAMPPLVHGLGNDRFGLLTLAWVVIGYFSLFDLGLGRALTKHVAAALGDGRSRDIAAIVWSALWAMAGLGLVAAGLILALTPALVGSVLDLPASLRDETKQAFAWLAVGVPVVILNAGLTGTLEAYQRFGLINAVRIPMSVAIFCGPLLVLSTTSHLAVHTAAIVLARALGLVALAWMCLSVVPGLRVVGGVERARIAPLIRFGGWLTVSNVIGPLMLYADRFVLGALISVGAVALYTLPFEIVTKALAVPVAIVGVMFPAFAEATAGATSGVRRLYRRTLGATFSIMFPLTIAVLLFADVGLHWWLGSTYADASAPVARILMVGVMLNSFGLVSQAYVQARGRPDLTAKLHMLELPLYLVYLPALVLAYGICGAATAWSVRVGLSAAALAWLAHRAHPRITASS